MDIEITEVFEGPVVAFLESHPLERIEPQIGENRHIDVDRSSDPSVWLVDHSEFPVVDTNCTQSAFREIEDLVAVGWPFAGQHGRLVVAVEMNLVGPVAELLALQQLVLDGRIASEGTRVGKKSRPEKMPFSTLPAGM